MKLVDLRKELELSQDELGALLGVTGRAVSYYENAERIPERAVMARIRKLSDNRVSSDSFYGVAE